MFKKNLAASRKSQLVFNLGTVGLVVVLIFSASLIKSFIDYTITVERSQAILQKIDSITILFERAESGYRGFLFSHDARYLKRYHIASSTIHDELQKLEDVMEGTTFQQESLALLRSTVTKRFNFNDEVIKESRDRPKQETVDKFLQSGMKEIRDILDSLDKEERRNLQDGKKAMDFRMKSGFILLCIGLFMSLGLMAFSRRVLAKTADQAFTQNSLLNSIIGNLSDGLVVVDKNGDVIFSNSNLEKIIKVDVMGLNLENRAQLFSCHNPISGNLIPSENLPLASALKGAAVEEMEVIIKLRNTSEEIQISVTTSPIYDSNKEIIGAMGLYKDISKRKQLENEWQKVRQTALDAIRLKSDFLTQMGHEIRTPMNGVMGLTNLLLNSKLNSEQQKYAEDIQLSAQYLLNMIQGVLDHSLLDKGELRLEKAGFNLSQAIQDSIKVLNPKAKAKNLQLLLELDVPPQLEVVSDASRIQELIVEQLESSIKKTEKGFVSLKVSVLEYFDNIVRVYFEVKDSNPSSPYNTNHEQDLKFILHQEIIRQLGGETDSEHRPGVGSKYSLTIDLEVKKTVGNDQNSSVKKFQSSRPVLVAEDQPINQVVIKKYLERFGLECHIVPDGQAAFEEAITGNYSLVLMDCKMQPVDGYDGTLMIREREKITGLKIPIVALTADGSQEDRLQCENVGMDDYLIKPIDIPKLESVLLKWIQPLIKEEFIKKLDGYQMEGQPLLSVLAADYFKSAPELIEKIESSLKNQDLKNVQYFSHTLKSASITLGLAELSSYCEKLEKVKSLPPQSEFIMKQIRSVYEKSVTLLKQRI